VFEQIDLGQRGAAVDAVSRSIGIDCHPVDTGGGRPGRHQLGEPLGMKETFAMTLTFAGVTWHCDLPGPGLPLGLFGKLTGKKAAWARTPHNNEGR
jgi:hypothetical protein